MCESCTNLNPVKRPRISELVDSFYIHHYSKETIIKIDETEAILKTRNIHSTKFMYYWLYLSQNDDSYSQLKLGKCYEFGDFVKVDIDKAIRYYNVSCDQDYIYAQNYLGSLYYTGKCVNRDYTKAIYYFSLASNQGFAVSDYNLAMTFHILNDFEKAIQYYKRAADKNYVKAQLELGKIYYHGQIVEKDFKKAFHYIKCAAKQNCSEAQYNLGIFYFEYKNKKQKGIHYLTLASNNNDINSQMYLYKIYSQGLNGSKDPSKAMYYLKLAAKNGSVIAQRTLGIIFFMGEYVTRDIDQSEYYFEMAAQQDDESSQFHLFVINSFMKKEGNIIKAFYYLDKSFKKNYYYAAYIMGYIFLNGYYVEKNIDKALYYFHHSADKNNNKEAQLLLGLLYFQNDFVKTNYEKGVHYLKLGARNNETNCLFLLVLLYYEGFKVPKNTNLTIKYLTMAANQNEISSAIFLAMLYVKGEIIRRDMNKAIHYYNIASSFGDCKSKNDLGVIYKNGFGVPKNIGVAIKYYNEAIKCGNDKLAMYNLPLIYLYNDNFSNYYNDAIKLLICSSDQGFRRAGFLLVIIFLQKINYFSIKTISQELAKFGCNSSRLPYMLYDIYIEYGNKLRTYHKTNCRNAFNHYKNFDYLYTYDKNELYITSKFLREKYVFRKDDTRKDLNSEFYEGFGIEI